MSVSWSNFLDWFDRTIPDVPARKETRYGQKGGDGPNARKKAATYRFNFPDGTGGRKKSFNVDSDTAYVGVYQVNGNWYAAGVAGEIIIINGVERPLYYHPDGYGSQQLVVVATKIKK